MEVDVDVDVEAAELAALEALEEAWLDAVALLACELAWLFWLAAELVSLVTLLTSLTVELLSALLCSLLGLALQAANKPSNVVDKTNNFLTFFI